MKADGLKAVIVLAFLIAPTPFLAPDVVVATASQGATREGNLFVGHYGEVLELDPAWTADARMEGDVELVRIYERKEGRPPPGGAL